MPRPLLFLSLLAMWLAATAVARGQNDAQQRLAWEIRPLLSDRCFQCHGPDNEHREADLRLDEPDGLQRVIDLQMPEQSELLRRIRSADPDEVMPPPHVKKPLRADQVQQVADWIRAGAPWSDHWAFQPIERPQLPAVHNRAWTRNAVDRFVLRQLEQRQIEPSPEASKSTLLRRVYLDLLGLLPSVTDLERFESDSAPGAYERLVDRLLASPHYGERWGRHWLDQARYADSDGYAIDNARVMWPYRDWVLAAINQDMPFDRFTIEQLAGDLLPDATPAQQIATGFHRNTLINQEGGTDPEQFRNEAVVDRVNTTGAVWLGLTLACAQCHTHKFDPISHREYFQLFAFFNSSVDRNSHSPEMLVVPEDQQNRWHELQQQGDAQESLRTFEAKFPRAMIMRDLDVPRRSFVHERGDFLREGESVTANTPAVLPPLNSAASPPSRLDLARWLVNNDNPLTARVAVNRVWMRLFGRGIVETENDFGTQGTPPSHPLLLDWLAAEFADHDWSLKRLHRAIVTSATYRQSSDNRRELRDLDPDNRLYARQSRIRVEAEIVRDVTLAASGLLTNRVGGPSVYPPQPQGVYAFTQNKKEWTESTNADRYRRGMYTFFYRSASHPDLTTFDAPNFQTTCTRRLRSNTPLQSLTQANSTLMQEAARELGQELARYANRHSLEMSCDNVMFVAFQKCLSRPPTAFELQRLSEYWSQQQSLYRQNEQDAQRLIGGQPVDSSPCDPADLAAWIATSRVLLNVDEFITRP